MSEEGARLSMRDDVHGTLMLEGEIDTYSATSLAARLRDDPSVTVLDLSAVSFIDSSGLRVLVAASEERVDGRGIQLRSPSAAVQRLLEISGLTGHLDVAG